MEKVINHIILGLTLVFLLFSCKKENRYDCIKSTGNIITETRSIENFTTLYLTNHIHVNIIPASYNSIEVNAGKNLLSLIKTYVSNDTLFIENDNKCNFMRSYKPQTTVDIYTNQLNDIYMYLATGNVTFKDTLKNSFIKLYAETCAGEIDALIVCDSSRIVVQGGTADLILKGKSNIRNSISHTSMGFLDAKNLSTPKTTVYNKSLNDVYVYSTQYLWAQISGKGNIYYSGNPSLIQSKIDNTGKLIEE